MTGRLPRGRTTRRSPDQLTVDASTRWNPGTPLHPVQRRRRKNRFPLPFVLVVLLIAAAGVWALVGALGHETPDRGTSTLASASGATPTTAVEQAPREPTPSFAEQGGMRIHLPVDALAVTALGFHQASFSNALAMTSLVPDCDMKLARELHAVPPSGDSENADPEVWDGACLRLWRSNRPGGPDTAADIGANPGTPVYSPVDGTIVEVKAYKLYDKYDDFEVHIQPTGRDTIQVVMIHIADPVIKVGDSLVGGVTRIGSVRKMSDKITNLQLREYTANGGDHVHVQVNDLTLPK